MKIKRPILGEKRIVKRFAILPLSINNGVDNYSRWLEFVTMEQQYIRDIDGLFLNYFNIIIAFLFCINIS